MKKHSQEVEVNGHLIDSMILTKIFDKIMNQGGEFEILELDVGKKKKDTSHARLLVSGKNAKHLEEILDDIHREGATPKNEKQVKLKKAIKDMVLPDNFYSTTNNDTWIFHNNKWVPVENQMMDKCIVVKNNKAYCVPIRDVKKNDLVVVDEIGVKVQAPERPRDKANIFAFMGSSSSSERPTQHIAKKVAQDILQTKKNGGKIVIVGGPAIVHTGAANAVADLIRRGYIDGVLAGNALAVHDIEYATLGTSLGMYVHDATLAKRGHRNHMDTINAVFKAGSIPKMVKSGKLKSGIFYECVKNNVPFVLAASIRDDGPLPDVITDIAQAQREYKKILKDASMVIMISTMLHSIATGNMLPAGVKVIVVDINQPTVTKLMDRGTWQALGIVSDVGAFLPLVAQEVKKLR
ncbi:TIGR00300 family protein [Nitrosopumilus sp. K4]|uniref:ornithine cyclodeaminase n=1 Tax=Nitrosopumilus sp. K4 TaxID=2795383 RepID=UPI001BAD7148|nr:TIGR00300 family protein [Nitrosopumilus sp. K4]QUC65449.1 TIGR00300 family protein [Nitrosopumilus sp. K4]